MSMYEKDANFEEAFKVGDRFVLTNMEYNGPINTRFGQAEKVTLHIVTRESYPQVVKYSAIGAGFANLAKRASAGDFPHVCEYILVPLPGSKQVKRFAPVKVDGIPLDPKYWVEGHNGDPINMEEFTPSGTPDTGASPDTGNVAGF